MALKENGFKVEKSGEIASLEYSDEDAFFNGNVSKKDLKIAADYTAAYIQEVAEMSAKKATKLMASNKKINEVLLSFPYGISKRGSVEVKAKRTVTFPGINGSKPVTRSDLRIVIKDPLTKIPKSKIKLLQAEMTKELLS